MREAERDVRELLDQEHADAARGDGLQRRHEPLDDDRREAERELVDEHDLRLRDESLGEHDHLLLATRQERAWTPQRFSSSGKSSSA